MSPTKKIADLPDSCMNPQHHPPSHQAFAPGLYEHTCPGCGQVSIFRVEGPRWGFDPWQRRLSEKH